jgi:hypothetical protein
MVLNSKIVTPDLNSQALIESITETTKASGNLTLDQLFKLMYYTLQIEQPGLRFAPAYPQYLIPGTKEYEAEQNVPIDEKNPTSLFSDTITYMVTRQEPGSIGGSKQPFSGMNRELVPRVRGTIKKSEDETYLVYGQWLDTLVQFDLWSLTSYEVEQQALWFFRFMTTHRNFFKQMGLSETFFWWRGRDAVANNLRNSLHVRTLVYYIRVEELSYEEEYNLKEIQLQVNTILKNEEA